MGTRQEIGKGAYKKIVRAIQEVEEEYSLLCAMPEFLKIDGQIFFQWDLQSDSTDIADEDK